MNTFQPSQLDNYNEESILAEIKRVIEKHFGGTPPSSQKFNEVSKVSSQTIRKYFGSFANGLDKAGFTDQRRNYAMYDLRRARYDKALMLDDLQRIKQVNNEAYFSQKFYQDNGGKYSVKTLKKHFNMSWDQLLQDHLSLTLKTTDRMVIHIPGEQRISEYSDESLHSELKRVWMDLGRRPTYSEFQNLGQIGMRVYERRFGGWMSAVKAHSVQTSSDPRGSVGSHTDKELLLEELRNVVEKSEISLLSFKTYRELGGSYSIGTFQNHFGSWKQAVKEIGRRDGHSGKFTDDKLFDEIQRLWEKYGAQPTFKNMNQDGNISGGVFQRRFGTWMKAIHAFCDDRNLINSVSEGTFANSFSWPSDDTIDPLAHEIPLVETVEQAIPSLSTEGNLEDFDKELTSRSNLVHSVRTAGKKLRFKVLERDRFTCHYCGRSPTNHGVVLHVDHITPWSCGGLTVLENLQTACEDCNLGKSDGLV